MSAVPPRDSHPSAPWTTQPDKTAHILPTTTTTITADDPTQTGKRRLFGLGLGKKKDKQADVTAADSAFSSTANMPATDSAFSPTANTTATDSAFSSTANMQSILQPSPPSPPSRMVAVSPPHRPFGPLSPQPSSSVAPVPVAPSQIFERNVQESAAPIEPSPGIPAHIQTEDHIPSVLEASSLAITDDRLDADHVEIVTHAAHQPAVDMVAEGTSSALQSEAQLSPQDSQHESFASFGSHAYEADDTASTYGALDPSDVHRLSFISFADVVQAEQAETSSLHHVPLSTTSLAQHTQSPPLGAPRSPSPARSPMSSKYSQDMTTPPIVGSNPTSIKGFDMSPVRSPIGSPPQQHGELNIETMRQVIQRVPSEERIGSLNL